MLVSDSLIQAPKAVWGSYTKLRSMNAQVSFICKAITSLRRYRELIVLDLHGLDLGGQSESTEATDPAGPLPVDLKCLQCAHL